MLLAQVEGFLEVAGGVKVVRAAEAMFVTQPTLTARLHALERELGEPLFARTRRGMRLTDAGRAFLPYAERAMRAVRDGRQALTDARTASAGRLVLGAAPAVSTYILPALLQRFAAAFPRVRGAGGSFGIRLADAAPRRSPAGDGSFDATPRHRIDPPLRRGAGPGRRTRSRLRRAIEGRHRRRRFRAPDLLRPDLELLRADPVFFSQPGRDTPRGDGARQYRVGQEDGGTPPRHRPPPPLGRRKRAGREDPDPDRGHRRAGDVAKDRGDPPPRPGPAVRNGRGFP